MAAEPHEDAVHLRVGLQVELQPALEPERAPKPEPEPEPSYQPRSMKENSIDAPESFEEPDVLECFEEPGGDALQLKAAPVLEPRRELEPERAPEPEPDPNRLR
eukprot:COSAG04_NODE_1357_length_7103_cov_8.062821_7_plen_104_part_00